MRTKVHSFVVLSMLAFGSTALAQDWNCPKPDKKATPEQIFQARYAAMQAQDLNAIACSYAEDAVVILPGSVVRGREAIMQAFSAFAAVLGGAAPTIVSMTSGDEVLLVLYTVTTPNASIPDGADTFVMHKGVIDYQVVHGSLVFSQQ